MDREDACSFDTDGCPSRTSTRYSPGLYRATTQASQVSAIVNGMTSVSDSKSQLQFKFSIGVCDDGADGCCGGAIYVVAVAVLVVRLYYIICSIRLK